MEQRVDFGRNLWHPEDWLEVRSPRWEQHSQWIQYDDAIGNYVPEDLTQENMQMGRNRTGETYISMLWKQPFHRTCRFCTECAFDDRMAPLLVFSQRLETVHHDHLEVVLWDHGINLWHHYFTDGKPSWKLLCFCDFDLLPGKRYKLSAQFLFNRKGVFLAMSCEGHRFGCRVDGMWPEEYYAGFTACEGRNRFFSFTAESSPELSGGMKERFSD